MAVSQNSQNYLPVWIISLLFGLSVATYSLPVSFSAYL